MKHLNLLLTAVCLLCTAAYGDAQEKDDSKYLAGAVPEMNGKVVFSKEFSIPGMGQEEVFGRVAGWMEARLARNGNNSRVVLADNGKGQIVGMGEEWIVFSSSALSLDRTKVLYQLTANCSPEKCVLRTERIRYVYREGKEKYSAEEWIVDKYALNKDKTKLVRGLAKWRRKTVDFVDALCMGVAEALSASAQADVPAEEVKAAEPKESKALVNSGTTVITPKNVVAVAPAQPSQPQTVAPVQTQETPVSQPQTTASVPQPYRAVDPADLPMEAVQTGAGKLVIVIGEEPFNMTMMTANSGGSLGKVDGKPVVFSILSPDQPHEQLDKAESYIVRFYPTGQTEPSVVLECRPLPAPTAIEGLPRTYVGEILNAQVKE